MAQVTTGRRGRPAAASREDVLAAAEDRFRAGARVDMQAIARELGLARATMHRWFGTREELIGEMLAELAERRFKAIRSQIPGGGAEALLACFDRFNRELAATDGMRIWLAQDQERALRILTSGAGIVEPRVVAAVEALIDAEVQAGTFAPAIPPPSLAYAIVRLAESFLYNDAIIGVRGDTDRLHEIEAALLGVARPGVS
jgi:AcrR family transcriptional regulator